MKKMTQGMTKRLLTLLIACSLLAPSLTYAQRVEYYHLDALGSVRAVTDEQGELLERHDYLPFGEEWNPRPSGQPRKFTGKERDRETGWDYFGARYYEASLARFTSIDPVINWDVNRVDPQRWNRYAYARNNPLKFVDPDGEDIVDIIDGAGDAIGSNFAFGIGRDTAPNQDFAIGQSIGDAASAVVGVLELSLGLRAAGGGLVLSGTGAGALAGVPAAAIGGAVVAHGGSAAALGILNLSKGLVPSGSYTITFKSGKKYHGKGPSERAQTSARRINKTHGDAPSSVDWEPAPSHREGFKAEARRIRADGGVKNPDNYNKINSPGERQLKEQN
jgi:RHS repeat-associated protein